MSGAGRRWRILAAAAAAAAEVAVTVCSEVALAVVVVVGVVLADVRVLGTVVGWPGEGRWAESLAGR